MRKRDQKRADAATLTPEPGAPSSQS
jgi:hypothetical protein